MLYSINKYVCLCSPICHKEIMDTGVFTDTGCFGVMVPPARELGHQVGSSDLTRLVFSQETLGGGQRASILPGTSYKSFI